MRLLLDTHVLIWFVEGRQELSTSSRRVLEDSAVDPGLMISAITFWEVAMLCARGRISVARPVQEWRRAILDTAGFEEIAVAGDVAVEAVQLPGELHADPADRILAATARLRGAHLATRDKPLIAYGRAGHLAVVKV